jgi:hypothetical protein
MLTPSQLSLVKAAILADPTLANLPSDGDSLGTIATALNAPSSPAFYVWKSSVQTQDVFDAIIWANFTPQDTPDGTTLWTNRSLQCQGKQFNVQTMLVGRDSINPSKTNIRAGLQDALTAIPSGASGANKSGGWASVNLILYRTASRVEQVLATGTGTTVSPALLGYEGTISSNDVDTARRS